MRACKLRGFPAFKPDVIVQRLKVRVTSAAGFAQETVRGLSLQVPHLCNREDLLEVTLLLSLGKDGVLYLPGQCKDIGKWNKTFVQSIYSLTEHIYDNQVCLSQLRWRTQLREPESFFGDGAPRYLCINSVIYSQEHEESCIKFVWFPSRRRTIFTGMKIIIFNVSIRKRQSRLPKHMTRRKYS